MALDHRTNQQPHHRTNRRAILPPQNQSQQPQGHGAISQCGHGRPAAGRANGEIQKIVDFLTDGECDNNADWKDRFKENSERMRTGSLLEVAAVLKGLLVLTRTSRFLSAKRKCWSAPAICWSANSPWLRIAKTSKSKRYSPRPYPRANCAFPKPPSSKHRLNRRQPLVILGSSRETLLINQTSPTNLTRLTEISLASMLIVLASRGKPKMATISPRRASADRSLPKAPTGIQGLDEITAVAFRAAGPLWSAAAPAQAKPCSPWSS